MNCPNCSQPVLATDQFCGNCRTQQPTTGWAVAPASPPAASTTPAATTTATTTTPSTPAPVQRPGIGRWFLIGGGALGALALCWAILVVGAFGAGLVQIPERPATAPGEPSPTPQGPLPPAGATPTSGAPALPTPSVEAVPPGITKPITSAVKFAVSAENGDLQGWFYPLQIVVIGSGSFGLDGELEVTNSPGRYFYSRGNERHSFKLGSGDTQLEFGGTNAEFAQSDLGYGAYRSGLLNTGDRVTFRLLFGGSLPQPLMADASQRIEICADWLAGCVVIR